MLPQINEIRTQKIRFDTFAGLNHKSIASQSEFKDMLNMSSDEFPYLITRKNRTVRQPRFFRDFGNIVGCCTYGSDIYSVHYGSDNGHDFNCILLKNFEPVVIDGNGVELLNNGSKRRMIRFGAYICIFPDNLMYNTEKNTIEKMDFHFQLGAEPKSYFYLSDKDGRPIIVDTTNFRYAIQTENTKAADTNVTNMIQQYHSSIIPNNVENTTISYSDNSSAVLKPAVIALGDKNQVKTYQNKTNYDVYYVSVDGKGNIMFETYSPDTEMWNEEDIYVTWMHQTSEEDIFNNFKNAIHDSDFIKFEFRRGGGSEVTEDYLGEVKWSFVEQLQNRVKAIKVLSKNNTISVVFSSEQFVDVLAKNYIKRTMGDGEVRGVVSMQTQIWHTNIADKIFVSKDIPEMDFVTVCANRIWGCSSDNHEIYSCKQGDATAWYSYGGLSNDSYAVTIAEPGRFTGAITFNDSPYFFKENKVYAIYGTKPRNYQIQEFKANGIQEGAENSLAQDSGYLYYKSKNGIEQFNGTSSRQISELLDVSDLTAFCGGTCNGKYHIVLGDFIFVYDIERRVWTKEEYLKIAKDMLFLENIGSNLYAIGRINNKAETIVVRIAGKATETEQYFTDNDPTIEDGFNWFVESGEFNAGSSDKKYISRVAFEMSVDDEASIFFSYDNGQWEKVYHTKNRNDKKTFTIPIITRRCERLRYKMSGKGKVIVYSITTTLEAGGD